VKRIPLTKELTLLRTHFYPAPKKPSSLPYRALVGIGGNVGNTPRRFKKLYRWLMNYPRIDVLSTAPILKNPPFGYHNQPDFYNSLLLIATSHHPMGLLEDMMRIEARFGRKRSFANAPRTLDLDIIFFESKKMYNNRLIIPHPHWMERESVMVPLVLLD